MRNAMVLAAGLCAAMLAMQAKAGDVTEDCPPAKMVPPDYPADSVRSARQGTAVVEARVDACGRVLEARIKTATRHAELNEAALAAARASVLPVNKRAEVVDGWIAWPIDFKVDSSLVSRRVDWPRSHRKVRYVVDAPLDPTISAAEWSLRQVEMTADTVRPPVLPLRHEFRQVRGEEGVEFWLFIPDDDKITKAAVRFRTVVEDDVPLVRMAMRCEFSDDQCAGLQQALAERGLPMAKPLD